jgi:hypothetical protein
MTVKPDTLGMQPPFLLAWNATEAQARAAKACDRRLKTRRGRRRAARRIGTSSRYAAPQQARRYNRALVPGTHFKLV